MPATISGGEAHILDDGRFDLSRVTIGLGWQLPEQEPPRSFLKKFIGTPAPSPFDLDAIALLLDSNGRIENLGNKRSLPDGRVQNMVNSDVIYYDNLHHPSGNIWHTGDSTEGANDHDAEQIIVDLNKIPHQYQSIVFMASLYEGKERDQHFGQVRNAYIRASDAQGKQIVRFDLSGNPTFSLMKAVTFAEVYRNHGKWEFLAIGKGHESGLVTDLLRPYVYY